MDTRGHFIGYSVPIVFPGLDMGQVGTLAAGS
jgi:hypothetical protein